MHFLCHVRHVIGVVAGKMTHLWPRRVSSWRGTGGCPWCQWSPGSRSRHCPWSPSCTPSSSSSSCYSPLTCKCPRWWLRSPPGRFRSESVRWCSSCRHLGVSTSQYRCQSGQLSVLKLKDLPLKILCLSFPRDVRSRAKWNWTLPPAPNMATL